MECRHKEETCGSLDSISSHSGPGVSLVPLSKLISELHASGKHDRAFQPGHDAYSQKGLQSYIVCCCQVVVGSGYTGPSMNPAHAFSWNYFLHVRLIQPPLFAHREVYLQLSMPCAGVWRVKDHLNCCWISVLHVCCVRGVQHIILLGHPLHLKTFSASPEYMEGCMQGHDRVQHLAVFWAAPLAGSLAAGLLWHAVTAPTKAKKRKPPAKPPAKAATTKKETKKAR